ncbi:MAG: 30S ribosomal protein S11 [Kiritimatiellia bacterium]|jgi:small subunit ribosomal protein S11
MSDEAIKEEAREDAPAAAEQAAAPAMSEAQAILAEADPKAAPVDTKKKGRGRSIPAGIAFIRASFNNTKVSITDARGGVIAWSSGGRAGFKGSRKSTAFAATMVAQDAARQAVAKGMSEAEVRIEGAGAGRESAVRAIQSAGIQVSVIKDCTPIPHNGCRPRKRRRV